MKHGLIVLNHHMGDGNAVPTAQAPASLIRRFEAARPSHKLVHEDQLEKVMPLGIILWHCIAGNDSLGEEEEG